jgi:hypothetical protein
MERVSGQMSLEKDVYSSARIRSDRQKAFSRHGVRRATGQYRDEIAIGSVDFWLEGAVGNSFAAGATKNGTFDLDTDGTLLGAANAFSGLFAGLNVTVTGLTQGGGQPVVAKIVEVAEDFSSIVLQKRDETAFTSEDDATLTIAVIGQVLKNGKQDVSYFIETRFPEISGASKFLHARGVKVDQAAFDLPTTGIATVNYTLRGLDQVTATTSQDAAPLEPIAGDLAASVNGSIRLAGEKIALLTAFNFTTTNSIAGDAVVGSNFVPKLFDGVFGVTGSYTAYMEDMSFIERFESEAELPLDVELAGADDTFLSIIMGRHKINSASVTADGTGGATVTVNFEALLDPISGCMLAFQSTYDEA